MREVYFLLYFQRVHWLTVAALLKTLYWQKANANSHIYGRISCKLLQNLNPPPLICTCKTSTPRLQINLQKSQENKGEIQKLTRLCVCVCVSGGNKDIMIFCVCMCVWFCVGVCQKDIYERDFCVWEGDFV